MSDPARSGDTSATLGCPPNDPSKGALKNNLGISLASTLEAQRPSIHESGELTFDECLGHGTEFIGTGFDFGRQLFPSGQLAGSGQNPKFSSDGTNMQPKLAIQIVTTVGDAAGAERLAHALVDRRLAACAQIDGPLVSVYRWQGSVETAQEWRVTFKTAECCRSAAEMAIRQLHPYDVPEILVVPIAGGSPDYLAWLSQQVDPGPADGSRDGP